MGCPLTMSLSVLLNISWAIKCKSQQVDSPPLTSTKV